MLINKKFTPTEEIQLEEIKRRVEKFGYKKDNPYIMSYLGFPSEVKGLKQRGILIPYSTEIPRVLNWYNLTPYGQTII